MLSTGKKLKNRQSPRKRATKSMRYVRSVEKKYPVKFAGTAMSDNAKDDSDSDMENSKTFSLKQWRQKKRSAMLEEILEDMEATDVLEKGNAKREDAREFRNRPAKLDKAGADSNGNGNKISNSNILDQLEETGRIIYQKEDLVTEWMQKEYGLTDEELDALIQGVLKKGEKERIKRLQDIQVSQQKFEKKEEFKMTTWEMLDTSNIEENKLSWEQRRTDEPEMPKFLYQNSYDERCRAGRNMRKIEKNDILGLELKQVSEDEERRKTKKLLQEEYDKQIGKLQERLRRALEKRAREKQRMDQAIDYEKTDETKMLRVRFSFSNLKSKEHEHVLETAPEQNMATASTNINHNTLCEKQVKTKTRAPLWQKHDETLQERLKQRETLIQWFSGYHTPKMTASQKANTPLRFAHLKKFCEDFDLIPDSFEAMAVFAELNLRRDYLTRDIWLKGMQKAECYHPDDLLSKIEWIKSNIRDSAEYRLWVSKKVYDYAVDAWNRAKALNQQLCLQLLRECFKHKEWAYSRQFLKFLINIRKKAELTKEQWCQLWDFAEEITAKENLKTYAFEGPWDKIFDIFVLWLRKIRA